MIKTEVRLPDGARNLPTTSDGFGMIEVVISLFLLTILSLSFLFTLTLSLPLSLFLILSQYS